MTTGYATSENGVGETRATDRVLAVALILPSAFDVTTEQVCRAYQALTGRIVHEDVMQATLFDAVRHGIATQTSNGWLMLDAQRIRLGQTIGHQFREAQ